MNDDPDRTTKEFPRWVSSNLGIFWKGTSVLLGVLAGGQNFVLRFQGGSLRTLFVAKRGGKGWGVLLQISHSHFYWEKGVRQGN